MVFALAGLVVMSTLEAMEVMDDFDSYLHQHGTDDDLIEGIGNEVLLGALLLLAFALAYTIIRRYENVSRVSRTYIHPSNLLAVNDARSTSTQQQQRTTNGTASATSATTQHDHHGNIRRHFGTMDGNCPICLNQLHLPIETNCGHLFCGRCIVIYWQHAQWRGGPIRCPVCRQQVNLLLPCFPTSMPNSSSSPSTSLTSSLSAATTEWLFYFLSFFYTPTTPTTTPTTRNTVPGTAPPPPSSQAPRAPSSTPTEGMTNGHHTNGNGHHHCPSPSLSQSHLHQQQQQQPDDLLNPSASTATTTISTIATPPNPMSERTNVIREVNSYNRRFSGEPRPWSDYLYDLPTLLRHLTTDFFSFNGLMYMFRIRIVLCVVAAIMYLISPLDMIPEAVFGIFGLFDDIVVVLLLAIYVTIIYRRFLSARWEME